MIYRVGDINVVPINLVDSYVQKLPGRFAITKVRRAKSFRIKKEKVIESAMEYLGKFYQTSSCVSFKSSTMVVVAILFSLEDNYNYDIEQTSYTVMKAVDEDCIFTDVRGRITIDQIF